MQLFYSPTSPYARKVRIVALEKDLKDRLTLVAVNPQEDLEQLSPVNPLGKVPALLLQSGEAVYDSLIICQYLDELDGQPTLLPPAGIERTRALTRHALAQGMTDAALNIVLERRRPPYQHFPFWLERWQNAINRGLLVLEQEAKAGRLGWDLAGIATASALGYLAFRLPDLAWPAETPALQAWWQEAQKLPSVIETAPPT